MTDLELTKACVEKMGIAWNADRTGTEILYDRGDGADDLYDPLNDDAQAMAMVKKFRLDIEHPERGKSLRTVIGWGNGKQTIAQSKDLNRAI